MNNDNTLLDFKINIKLSNPQVTEVNHTYNVRILINKKKQSIPTY